MKATAEPGLTKLTAKLFAPMYADFDRQITGALLRRDAFLDRMIQQEIPYLREDLQGKQLSLEANRYISRSLKGLGGKKAPPLKQTSIAVRHETAQALRAVVEDHNLVRDAFLNRLIALLRSSDKFLDSLGLPNRVRWNRGDGTEDMPTSPMKVIEETLWDPFYYLRSACQTQYGYGLNVLEFPKELHGMCCYLPDDQVPGTEANAKRLLEEKEAFDLLGELDDFEDKLTPTNASTQGA